MTAIVPRRNFDDFEHELDAASGGNAHVAAELRAQGKIRVHATISIELNERLKATARRQGIYATDFIGQLITRSADELVRIDARLEAQRLQEYFGDQWLQILQDSDLP